MNIEKKLDKILNDVEKPGRYIGDEWGCVKKDPKKVDLNFVYCFPDIYEIGMSHLGIKILYDIVNKRENMWAQRAFMVWGDMEEKMRENNIPLYTMESKMPLKEADILGFTMQYELSFSTQQQYPHLREYHEDLLKQQVLFSYLINKDECQKEQYKHLQIQ